MSTYELDDELVRRFVDFHHRHDLHTPVVAELAVVLHEQLPIPVPTKFGAVVAVVRQGRQDCYIRTCDDDTVLPQWRSTEGHTVKTEDLGRIVSVLSEGVDL